MILKAGLTEIMTFLFQSSQNQSRALENLLVLSKSNFVVWSMIHIQIWFKKVPAHGSALFPGFPKKENLNPKTSYKGDTNENMPHALERLLLLMPPGLFFEKRCHQGHTGVQCHRALAPKAKFLLPHYSTLPYHQFILHWIPTAANASSSIMIQHPNEYLTDEIRVNTFHYPIADPPITSLGTTYRSSTISMKIREITIVEFA